MFLRIEATGGKERPVNKPVAKRRTGMAGKSFGEELGGEMAGKAIMWGPAIAGAVLLGPVGVVLGLAASVAIVVSSCSDNPTMPSGGNPPKE